MDKAEIQPRDVSLTRDLLQRGLSGAELAKKRKSGSLDRVRRGAYATATVGLSKADRHRQLVFGTMPRLSPQSAVSHTSAALLHGLPVLDADLDRVHATRSRIGGQGRMARYVQVHGAAIDEAEVVMLNGLRVTSVERTMLDCARILPVGPGLAIVDQGLRVGADFEQFARLLDLHRRRRGARTARLVAELADPRSESAGESMSRTLFLEHGVPMPDLQRELFDDDGRLVARVDFCWEEQRTVGEFDGKIKYGRALAAGQPIEEVLYQEKLREDAIRDLGWQVVRWIWRDLYRPQVVVERLDRAFARAARSPW